MSEIRPEPWLRGPLDDTPALLQPVFQSFLQVREDLARHASGLSPEQVWRPVAGASLGFHLKHLAGSVDRLTTYFLKGQLSQDQLSTLGNERFGRESADELIQSVATVLRNAEERLRGVNLPDISEKRTVGRKHLPTTVIGLLVHICEHTQRHLGQAITTAKLVRTSG